MFPIFSERWERSIYSYQRINCRCSSLINCPTFFNAQWTGLEKPWPMGSRWRCSPRIQFSKIAWVIPQVIPRFHHPGLQHVPIWWFGTWLALKKSISFFWHSRGMSSFPLTNSIIFQDGHIAPPTSHISPSNSHRIPRGISFWNQRLASGDVEEPSLDASLHLSELVASLDRVSRDGWNSQPYTLW